MKTAILLADVAVEHGAELPFAPIFFGLITLSILIVLMIVCYSWKGISHRH